MNHASPFIQKVFADAPEVGEEDLLMNAAFFVRPAFDGMVAALADPSIVPLDRINNICTLLWQMIGSHTTEFALCDLPFVKSLSFLGVASPGTDKPSHAVVLAPLFGYAKAIVTDPWMQLGGVVFNASKVRDYWSGRLADVDTTVHRAGAHEAEFLRFAQQDPTFTPNDYQLRVLSTYPEFPPDLVYEAAPFDLQRAQQAFRSYSGHPIHAPIGPPHLLPRA